MSERSFAISVDAAAAVRALTERTRPSLAFDSVRVVRRALALGAVRVDVTCTADRFTVAWQGASPPAAEIALIGQVLDAEDEAARASALLVLEERHGLALLAVLATSRRAELHGASPLAAERGRLITPPSSSAADRPRVIVWRDADPKEERRQLGAWCRHADAPLYVDGKRVDRPFPRAHEHGGRFARRVRGPEGRAVVALAPSAAKSRVVAYSHGVYLGVSQHTRAGVPIIAHVSVRDFGPEDDTGAARRAVDVVVQASEAALVRGIAATFGELSRAERTAVHDAFLDTDGAAWSAAVRALPLFHAVGAPFSLSLDDLAAAGEIPATSYARGHLPGTPQLDVRARAFLRRALGDVVHPALPAGGAVSTWWARVRGSPRIALR